MHLPPSRAASLRPAPMPTPRPLVLASTSTYRRELLARLRLPFDVASPGVDESAIAGESPPVRAERLAIAKAQALAARFPEALLIGSDQVAAIGTEIFDKPGTHENAVAQLERASGRRMAFHTAVAIHAPAERRTSVRVVPYYAEFRALDRREIEAYLRADRPYDCSAAAKVESLGITLLRSMEGEDPTALVGLPLIALSEMLRQYGLQVP